MAIETKVDASGQSAAQLAEPSGITQQEVTTEQQRTAGTGINPDVLIGGILTNKAKSALTTAGPAIAQLDSRAQEVQDLSRDIIDAPPLTGTVLPAATAPAVQQPAITPEQQLITSQRDLATQEFNAFAEQVRIQAERDVKATEIATRQQEGSAIAFASRGVGFSTAMVGYINSITQAGASRITAIRQQAESAVQQAMFAKSRFDLELVDKALTAIRQAKNDAIVARDQQMKEVAFAFELQKFKRETLSETIDAYASTGTAIDDIPEIFWQSADSAAGYTTGVSKGLYSIALEDRRTEKTKSDLELFNLLADTLSKIDSKQSVTINGKEFFGSKSNTVFKGYEVDKRTGNINAIVWDESTGSLRITTQKGALSPNIEYDRVTRDGRDWYVPKNPLDGPAVPVLTTQVGGAQGVNVGLLSEAFPQGEVPFGTTNGWCVEYIRRLVNDPSFPAPGTIDSIESKRALSDPSIGFDTGRFPQAGDMIFLNSDAKYGHMALITGIETDPITGERVAIVSESNYKTDGQGKGVVGHDRTIPLTAENMEGNGGSIMGFRKFSLDNRLSSQSVQTVQLGELSKEEKEELKSQPDKILAIQTKIGLIDEIEANKLGAAGVVGLFPGITTLKSIFNKGERIDFMASVQQLVSKETLSALINVKAQGGTFGALSDGERVLLQNAATKISGWIEKESADPNATPTGNIITSFKSFNKEVVLIKALAQKALARAQGNEGGFIAVINKSTGEKGFVNAIDFNPFDFKIR